MCSEWTINLIIFKRLQDFSNSISPIIWKWGEKKNYAWLYYLHQYSAFIRRRTIHFYVKMVLQSKVVFGNVDQICLFLDTKSKHVRWNVRVFLCVLRNSCSFGKDFYNVAYLLAYNFIWRNYNFPYISILFSFFVYYFIETMK